MYLFVGLSVVDMCCNVFSWYRRTEQVMYSIYSWPLVKSALPDECMELFLVPANFPQFV